MLHSHGIQHGTMLSSGDCPTMALFRLCSSEWLSFFRAHAYTIPGRSSFVRNWRRGSGVCHRHGAAILHNVSQNRMEGEMVFSVGSVNFESRVLRGRANDSRSTHECQIGSIGIFESAFNKIGDRWGRFYSSCHTLD